MADEQQEQSQEVQPQDPAARIAALEKSLSNAEAVIEHLRERIAGAEARANERARDAYAEARAATERSLLPPWKLIARVEDTMLRALVARFDQLLSYPESAAHMRASEFDEITRIAEKIGEFKKSLPAE